MTRSFESCENVESSIGAKEIDLPNCEGLRVMPGGGSIEQMMERSHALRQWFPQGIPTAQERWEAKRAVEFRL
ncbi:MAG: hypothetical protein M2R45_03571 [Verrucomicrobia subdivision 3 bacterium]|nr:hypothetical protein [Limisphaerales bacterium]MCS1414796.1 hypothetical protein [Limisphaerales bacterium]